MPRISVLVVDDESLLAFDLAEQLKRSGFVVVGPASSVARALELLETTACDAAVLDINLRSQTSEPIAHELLRRGVPFIALTGYAGDQRPAVFDGVPTLQKPIRIADCVSQLHECLKGRQTGRK